VIGERTIDGFTALTLSSDEQDLEAAFVPSVGMVGCSLRHQGSELLGQRDGLEAYASDGGTMGIPLLYPWANRVGRMRFPLLGQEVVLDRASSRLSFDPNGLPIHGLLAGARGWQLERHEVIGDSAVLAARFDFTAEKDLMAAFPFAHWILVEATLTGSTLTVVTTVRASGESAIPISFGYHPYFRLPGSDRTDWEVQIPVRERLELDNLMLPTGQREPAEIGGATLGTRTFDDAYVAPAGDAPFVLTGGGKRIEVSIGEGYPFAQVYAPHDDDVIAYEPMTAPTNAFVTGGSDLPLVAPGESYAATFSITVYEIPDVQP
jgi:galactose mutarotase-like enzyme